MPEPQANQPINFRSFADWCKHKDSLSESARHTVEVLLERAGTSDCHEAEKVLLNLTELHLYGDRITDISPLSILTNLTVLSLTDTQISDITSLSGLTNLTQLNLEFNRITDITGLSALTNLTELSLNNNQITDITGLSALTNLTELSLRGNQISDITSLSALINLTYLELLYNGITDITGLSALTNLTVLDLNSNQITDITPLSLLTNLTKLSLQCNRITEIAGLSGLTNLTELSLYFNPIIDLNVSSELTQKYVTLSTRLIDTQKATETVKKIYVAIGKETPQVIMCSSPQVASIKLCQLLQIGSISQNQMSEIATAKSRWRQPLLRGFFPSVNVRFSGLELCNALSHAILIEEEDNADWILVSEFQKFLQKDLESLGDDFDSCSNYLEPLSATDLVKEIHLTEFLISKFAVTLDEKARELLLCKQQLFEECGWILPFEKVCLICDRPLHLRFDAENRLHAEAEPAIAFADGYSLYFHHGVKLPEQYGKVHPDLWQAEWLLSEENAEIRRVLIERMGYDRICQQLQAVELDSWQEYTLLKIDNADVEPIYLLKMTCPSTGHIHALRVPPDVVSAQEAIRWVNWDIDSEDFLVQT